MNEKNLNNFHAGGNSDQPFDPGTFDQEERIRKLRDSFKNEAEKNINAGIKSEEDAEVKQDEENNYDKPAPEEEIAGLKKEIADILEKKAAEFGLSKDDLIKMDEDFCILEDNLEKSNFATKEEKKLEKFREELCQAIEEGAPTTEISKNKVASTEEKFKRAVKRAVRDFISKKENLKSEREMLCNYWILNGSEEIRKRVKEDAEEEGLSEECLSKIADTIEKSDFEKGIKEKAKKLGIPEEILYEFASLNIGNLYSDDLYSDLESDLKSYIIFRDGLKENLSQIGLKNKESDSRATKFTEKHKKAVGIGELALYLSAFGAPALKELAGDHAQVDVDGQKISLEDLAKNPDLIKETGLFHKSSTPINVPLEHFNAEFLFKIDTKIGADNNSEKYIYFDKLINNHIFDESNENINFSKMEKELGEMGISLNGEEGGCSFDSFYENREAIINIISENLDIPKDKVEKYIKNIIELETSQMSLVKWEDWKVGKNSEVAENNLKLQKEKERTSYKVFGSFKGTLEEKTQKTEEEWLKWGKENGYDDVNKALEKEIEAYENSPMGKFKKFEEVGFKQVAEAKKETGNPEKDAEFGNRFLEKLNESGYSMDELKKIAEKDPEKVIEITAKIIGKNVEYDLIQYLGFSKFIKKSDHSEDTPEDTLKKGLGVCDNYAKTLAAAIYFLKENNVPNFDKIAILTTVVNTDYGEHASNTLITADEKLSSTSIDLTWADDENISKIPEKLNAVDDKHYYTKIKEKVGEAHQKALDKIKDWNGFVFQEKLKEILTQYDPRSRKKDQKIEGNQKLRKMEKDIEPLREEKSKSVREHLELMRDKLKKIYAKKDAGSE